MLSDLDKQLLNELGITAIGDCLSILKHSKAVLSRVIKLNVKISTYFIIEIHFFLIQLEEKNKEFDVSDSQAVNEVNQSKTRCQVVKRIIKTYLNDAPSSDVNTKTSNEKPLDNSTLSSNLVSRLGFNSSVAKPIVTFNEESLKNNKVLVSSTTSDETINPISKGRSLKRKLNDDDIDDNKPLEYQGTLKDPTPNGPKIIVKLNKSSLNDHSMLISTNQSVPNAIVTDFSRLNSPNLRITKTIQLNKKEMKSTSEVEHTRTAELSNLKVSVFKRIKSVNKADIAIEEKRPAGIDKNSNSKVISLKKIKTTSSTTTTPRINSKPSANNYLKTTDIKSRLKFN